MSGGGDQTTTTRSIIPPELLNILRQTGDRVLDFQANNPLSDFSSENQRDVAGMSPLEQWAAGLVQNQYNDPADYEAARQSLADTQAYALPADMGAADYDAARTSLGDMRNISQRQVTGANVADDPAIAQAMEVYKDQIMPEMQNQYSMMGLGRSGALGTGVAKGGAQMMLPLIQDSLAREERGIDRELGTAGNAAGGYMNLGGAEAGRGFGLFDRATGRGLNLAGSYAGLGGASSANQNAALDRAMGYGAVGRGVEDDTNYAAYEDFLRRQGLAENALWVPFGQSQNQIGQSTTASGGGK